MPMISSPTKARGVYRLLQNGGCKTGCAITETKTIRGRVLEQIMEKINGMNSKQMKEVLQNVSGI